MSGPKCQFTGIVRFHDLSLTLHHIHIPAFCQLFLIPTFNCFSSIPYWWSSLILKQCTVKTAAMSEVFVG